MDAAWGGPSGFKMKSIRKIITVWAVEEAAAAVKRDRCKIGFALQMFLGMKSNKT
jgi:hypothetical protein